MVVGDLHAADQIEITVDQPALAAGQREGREVIDVVQRQLGLVQLERQVVEARVIER